ncbi:peptide/nickel transport system substrate-binding protein [Halogranum gelatinilyticum]|uniref:Peptide/nickel transport system substrate-binding protein n=1 Tax=Halogranum gelatinilyticum TaxID=660521 RepID=A0A1G9P093_9EURY|nr:ABC transporter substrate-binding protein [Halogranum gelatinilyticum]SDL92228.1 peptide/nickel transport system substrate-binding protein [Halogranum gelatinilyticum]
MTDSNSLSRRRFLQATGGAASAVALAGCTDGGDGGSTDETTADDGGQETSEPSDGGNENYLQYINSTVTTFDPVASTDEASANVISNIHQTLVHYPRGEPQTEALLAADYSVSEDGLTYTFTLNEATFHNGDAVTADDLVYSWERLAASENTRRSSFLLDVLGVEHETETTTNGDGEEVETYAPGTLAIEPVSETEVEVTLSQPFASALGMIAYNAFAVHPENIVGDVPGYEGTMEYTEFATSNPVGCGPYELENWEQGTSVDITAFDDYYGEGPVNDGVHWQIIEDPDAQWTYTMEKNADAFGIPTSKYDPSLVSVEETDDQGRELGTYGPVRNDSTLNYSGISELVTYYIGFNMAAVPKPVRQAFAYAVNRDVIINEVFKQRGESAFHLTPPAIYPGGANAYNEHVESEYPYGVNESQLDEARRVMEEAGYGPDNRYELQWTQYQSSTWESMANILRDQLASAYIDMQIESAPFATLTQRGRQGNLEVYTLGWGADYPAPDNFLQLLNPEETITGGDTAPISYLNWTEENGSAAQEATEAWQTILNNKAPTDEAAEARAEAAVTMEEANWEDIGFINLYHPKGESFWYDWIDYQPPGAMGAANVMEKDIELTGSRE